MARISGNDEIPSGDFSDSSQLTNWILDNGSTCHIKTHVFYFTPGSLEDTDKKLKMRMDITSWRSKNDKFK